MYFEKIYTIIVSDGKKIEVNKEDLDYCITLRDLFENVEFCSNEPIYLSDIDSDIFNKILEWIQYHRNNRNIYIPDKDDMSIENLCEFDKTFLSPSLEFKDLTFKLIIAVNYLNINDLLNICCLNISEMMKEKSVEELRNIFDVENDYTLEEEKWVKEENKMNEEN